VVTRGAQVGTDEAVAGGGADAAPAAADLHLELHHALGLFGGVVQANRRLRVIGAVRRQRAGCG
jgi:hypothetical protein